MWSVVYSSNSSNNSSSCAILLYNFTGIYGHLSKATSLKSSKWPKYSLRMTKCHGFVTTDLQVLYFEAKLLKVHSIHCDTLLFHRFIRFYSIFTLTDCCLIFGFKYLIVMHTRITFLFWLVHPVFGMWKPVTDTCTL